jgi:hypothetical protein
LTGYHTGFHNGIDHGIRLRANLRYPVVGCTVCGADHPTPSEFPEGRILSDTFDKDDQVGLGTDELEVDWDNIELVAGGTAAIEDGVAVFDLPGIGSHVAANPTAVTVRDARAHIEFKLNKVPAPGGADNYLRIYHRVTHPSPDYAVFANVTGTAIGLLVSENVGGFSIFALAAVPRETFAADTWFHFMTEVFGASPTTIRAKVWQDGTDEPGAWDISTTDSSVGLQVAGEMAFSFTLEDELTNEPIRASFRNWRVDDLAA